MTSNNSLDITSLQYYPIDSNFGYVEYNGINLYVSSDKQWFNATKLTKSLKDSTINSHVSINRLTWYNLVNACPDLFQEINGKGTQVYKGWFASIILLPQIASLIEPVRGTTWYFGRSWHDNDSKGLLYLIQPPRLVGTNIFKIGETKNMLRRLSNNEYGKGTYIYGIVNVTNRRQAENILIKHFKDNGAILKERYEYFELSGLEEAQRLFENTPLDELLDLSNGKPLHLYKPGEWIHGEIVPTIDNDYEMFEQ